MTEFVEVRDVEDEDDGYKRPEWTGGADCYLAEWGEYERSGASWTYRKTLREAIMIPERYYGYYSGSEFDVVAKLHVGGVRRGSRYTPTHWGLYIEFGKYSDNLLPEKAFPRLHGKCRSIVDAQRQASQAVTDERVQALLKAAYGRNFQTKCVYRLKDSTPRKESLDRWAFRRPEYDEAVLLDPANWEPWASDCSTSHTWGRWMPTGRYFEISREHDGTIRGHYTDHEPGMTSGRGSPEFSQLARALAGWTSTEIDRLVEAADYQVWVFFQDDATLKVEPGILVIETKLGVEEADKRLRRLEDRWWLKVMPKDGSLVLELRHVGP